MSTGQILGGGGGAVIGALLAAPTGGVSLAAGAIYGAQIGIMAGGLLDPPKGPTVEGPRLSDLSVQTSTYGQFIPRTYGTIGLSGNVFWLENNKIKEVVKKKKSGGKGGGSSSTVKTYTYFATFAVGLCEGPIAGVRRIWVGPDLVYDAGSDDLETIISSNQASAKFTIYTGTDTQQPDPRMQAEMGVANCPAFRGLAYIVVKDLALADYGNSIAGAQIKVEVVNSLSVAPMLSESASHPLTGLVGPQGVFSIGASDRLAKGFSVRQVTTAGVTVENYESIELGGGQPITRYIVASSTVGAAISVLVTGKYPNLKTPIHGRRDGAMWYGGNYYPVPEIPGQPTDYADYKGDILLMHTGVVRRLTQAGIEATSPAVGSCTQMRLIGDEVFCIQTGTTFVLDALSLDIKSSYSNSINMSEKLLSGGDSELWLSDYSSSRLKNAHRLDSTGSSIAESFSLPEFGGSNTSFYVNGNLIVRASNGSGVMKYEAWSLSGVTDNTVSLASIFEAESELSSLIKTTDIDATGLSDSVTGFKVTATGSIRNAIEPLRGAWPFDVVQAGYKIKATSRGSASVVTIPIGELAIDTQLTESREMDSQLPQNVTVKYIDRERDYDVNEQRAQRDNTEAVNSLVLELPVVLSSTQSAQVADKLIRIYVLEKSDFSFTLPAPYRYLEPGDVVTISADDADYVLRLVSVNQTADGRLECAGRPSSAATYTSIAPGDGGQQGGTVIPLTGATIGILIDCPVIDEGLQNSPGFAVGMNGYSAGWPGGILYRTADNGQTWDDLQALDGRATAGYAAGVLAASAGNLIQRGGSLTVSLIGGTLESVTEAQMLNGANIAAYGVNGRWEILRFQNATLNGDGTYTLDTFWRGDKGTEWATGLHAANDIFVLMTDPDLAFVGMPTDSIGQPRDYRAITAGADIDSAASQAFTYSAVNLETLSGVHPRGRRSAGDLTINWQRRTRVGGAWRDFVDASLGEATESYEVDIIDGATVKRTITATIPAVLYTSAMQVTDFGSPQASVTVNIYQLSAVVGRGYKLEATL